MCVMFSFDPFGVLLGGDRRSHYTMADFLADCQQLSGAQFLRRENAKGIRAETGEESGAKISGAIS